MLIFRFCLPSFCGVLPTLIGLLLEKVNYQAVDRGQSLVDSLPITLCSGKRQAKPVPEFMCLTPASENDLTTMFTKYAQRRDF